ncbi:AgmX/PglI C-terminal domain-containing protein [Litoribrevibacter euphylliae]|uniref:AgmX/PglI C-terminal domain-containing protein n=1 Tax=Litoribrevibacter euphylliae TaxID=1834034 RepID=A0ABV7HEK2_9GAMM
MATVIPQYQLPWTIIPEDQSRYQKILRTILALVLILGFVMPFIPLTEPEREELEKLPPQLSKVILKKKVVPPPPPPPKPEKKEEKKPEPKEEKPKEKKPEPKKEKPKPKPDQKKLEKAREKAKSSGLLKHTDALKELRQSLDLGTLAKGSTVNQGGKEATKVERAVIASKATTGSGGVSAAGVSRGTAGSGLQGQGVAELNDETALADMAAEADQKARSGKKGKRTDEEIRRVFDANKGPMFTIYNRALRKNPLLEGKVKFEFTIEPDGSVSACKVVSSELNDPKLERRLVARIRLFDFGARDVERGTYQLWYEFTQG